MLRKLLCVAAFASVALRASDIRFLSLNHLLDICFIGRIIKYLAHAGRDAHISHAHLARRNHIVKHCAAAYGEMFARRSAAKRDLLHKRWTPQNDTIQNTACILDNDVTQYVFFKAIF